MLILAFFAAAALACDPFRGQDPSLFSTPEQDARNISRRWADKVSNSNRAIFWPRDPDTKIATIRYCFADNKAWKNWGQHVYYAAYYWLYFLDPPGAEKGHGVTIERHDWTSETPPPFCFLQLPSGIYEYDGVWNPQVHADSVVIWDQFTTGGRLFGASATWGYKAGANENRMVIKYDLRPYVGQDQLAYHYAAIAHEFGHTFGLGHEHQRLDRDRYVHFDCSLLDGYSDALRTIEAMKAAGLQPATIEQICDDFGLAHGYGIPAAAEYCKEPTLRIGGDFDINSIMLYESLPYDITMAPLVKWIGKIPDGIDIPTQRTPDNCMLIPMNNSPSPQDISGVKSMYPYQPPDQ